VSAEDYDYDLNDPTLDEAARKIQQAYRAALHNRVNEIHISRRKLEELLDSDDEEEEVSNKRARVEAPQQAQEPSESVQEAAPESVQEAAPESVQKAVPESIQEAVPEDEQMANLSETAQELVQANSNDNLDDWQEVVTDRGNYWYSASTGKVTSVGSERPKTTPGVWEASVPAVQSTEAVQTTDTLETTEAVQNSATVPSTETLETTESVETTEPTKQTETVAQEGETRQTVATHEVIATLQGVRQQRCRFKTSLCPNQCNHGGPVAVFKIDQYVQMTPGDYQPTDATTVPTEESTFAMRVVVDGKEGIEQWAVDTVNGLEQGNQVKLTWVHDYVTTTDSEGRSGSGPVRRVTQLEKM
jgi:hypothetical protein